MSTVTLSRDRFYLIQLIDSRNGSKSPAMIVTPKMLIEAADEVTGLTDEQISLKLEYYKHAMVDVLSDYEAISTAEITEDITVRDFILAIPIFHFDSFRKYFSITEETTNEPS